MPKEIKAAAVQGGIRHDNHTAPASFTVRNINPKVNYIIIQNTSNSNDAQVSFDGISGFTISKRASFSIEASGLNKYWTKAVSGSPTLEVILAGEE